VEKGDIIVGSNNGNEHESGTSGAVITERRVQTRRPSLYRVLLHNDDFTPMEFVILILEKFFAKGHAEAQEIMLNVHTKGVGQCGIYPFEIAETKVALVMECARENEHPLQCSMEKA